MPDPQPTSTDRPSRVYSAIVVVLRLVAALALVGVVLPPVAGAVAVWMLAVALHLRSFDRPPATSPNGADSDRTESRAELGATP